MMLNPTRPLSKQRAQVLGRSMAYAEVGRGDPIVLLHGNPTSSYLWRNVVPQRQGLGRCVAPDLIGMGDSDQLPGSGPASYTFVEHRRYTARSIRGHPSRSTRRAADSLGRGRSSADCTASTDGLPDPRGILR
jgi:pimeloyl-ACP methyl ester carboxylesterase